MMRISRGSAPRPARQRTWTAAAVLALAGASFAQPPNDECGGAIALVDGLNGGLTSVAATSSAQAAPSCAPLSTDVWFTYTASCSGNVAFSMCGNGPAFDSVLAVYTGTCGALTEVACDDDFCGGADLSQALAVGVSPGTSLIVRVGTFGAGGAGGAFGILVTCAVPPPPADDFGDAPAAAGIARHTNATASERLGTAVTAENLTVTPSWYGDAGDDGIVSVSNLFPGSTTATIVVNATNPNGPFTDHCRIWVDRNNGMGWSTATDALPTQSALVGPGGTNFTFGPFTYTTTAPPSPFVRVRLSFDTTGVASAIGTGAFGEVEDHVLPGSGGPNTAGLAGGGGADAGDAPLPYPPCGSAFIASERLGLAVTPDANAPVGPGVGAGAWHDDSDDGIVRIDGLRPGGSLTIVVSAIDPAGTFTDTISGWVDFDGNGSWDQANEAFAPVSIPVGTVATTATLGPLAVPVTAVAPLKARLKLSFGATGGQAAGAAFTFGEVEDYLLPPTGGVGCNTAPGPAPTIWAEDPPRAGLPFTWKEAGLAPLVNTVLIANPMTFLPAGIDVSLLVPGLVPPATCFLYVSLGGVIASIGPADPAGRISVTVPVPLGVAGATAYLQSFQVAPPLSLLVTPALRVTVLP